MFGHKNKYGQYFTPKFVADFMVSMIGKPSTAKVLEPCCGEGVFLQSLADKNFRQVVAYEIDPTLSNTFAVNYLSFISAPIHDRFDVIIGNPPYIRWKNLESELKQELVLDSDWQNYFNALCDYLFIFIIKSIKLLKEDGELIFICPEYWFNTKHAQNLRNFMISHGYFSQIIHFKENKIFDDVTSSIVIFKYTKSTHPNHKQAIDITVVMGRKTVDTALLNQIASRKSVSGVKFFLQKQFEQNSVWSLQPIEKLNKIQAFEQKCRSKRTQKIVRIGDICDIGNGMVSGLDKAFQYSDKATNTFEQTHLIQVVKAKHLKPYWAEQAISYIFIQQPLSQNDFEKNFPNFRNHLSNFKEKLDNRYQYNRHIPYWEWVFLRNFTLFCKRQPRIFVPCKERISNKNYFRFAWIESNFFPTQDVTGLLKKDSAKESLEYILAYLNQDFVFDWLQCKGVIKGNIVEFSEKPLASIPFYSIDWDDSQAVVLHDEITALTQQIIKQKDPTLTTIITEKFKQLMAR